ncbi:MAG: T9SS type A sorting domain-containing protein, partial [Ignavibacteria bacterium]|nr:T9SS type A sorting domain-containing protein [Ignavibacteria bacterium]
RLRLLNNYNMIEVTPVELTSFYATTTDNSVLLDWTTATEINNLGFEVQRLNDLKIEKLKDWENIGFVNGNGTTTIENHYKFTDNEIVDGKYLYRLKQIDFDGSFSYSNVLEILIETLPKEFSLSDNYPNPFNPNTIIQFALPEDLNNVTLTIYNALGQRVAVLVNSKMEAGKYSYLWNASDVATGLYIYELRTDKFVSVKKMMLLK